MQARASTLEARVESLLRDAQAAAAENARAVETARTRERTCAENAEQAQEQARRLQGQLAADKSQNEKRLAELDRQCQEARRERVRSSSAPAMLAGFATLRYVCAIIS